MPFDNMNEVIHSRQSFELQMLLKTKQNKHTIPIPTSNHHHNKPQNIASKIPVLNQNPESSYYPKFINARISMFLVCVEGDRGMTNSLWKEIYRSLEKLQSPSQSYFCSNNLNIEKWIHDHLLVGTEDITGTDCDLADISWDFKSRNPRELSYYLPMYTCQEDHL